MKKYFLENKPNYLQICPYNFWYGVSCVRIDATNIISVFRLVPSVCTLNFGDSQSRYSNKIYSWKKLFIPMSMNWNWSSENRGAPHITFVIDRQLLHRRRSIEIKEVKFFLPTAFFSSQLWSRSARYQVNFLSLSTRAFRFWSTMRQIWIPLQMSAHIVLLRCLRYLAYILEKMGLFG